MKSEMPVTKIRANCATLFSLAALPLAVAFLGHPAAATELTTPLTAEEVACNERQLEGLLLRMNVAEERYTYPQVARSLLVSYSNSVGFYDGLALTGQGFRSSEAIRAVEPPYERYLAFNLNPSIRSLRLNPARPELPQIGLSREDNNSNLVTPGGYYDLSLTLEPTLGGGDPLTINNFKVPASGAPYNGFLANSTKPGRGLTQDGLLTPCHDKLTEFDRHVFSILQRMTRGGDESAYYQPDIEFSIFRGEDPHVYRINVYPIYEHLQPGGRLAIELTLSWSSTGVLTTGVMRVLPVCAVSGELGCTAVTHITPIVFLIPPLFGGAEYYDGDADENGVIFVWYEAPRPPTTIDLGALLARTAWNRPVW
jgi:hypothetical protein